MEGQEGRGINDKHPREEAFEGSGEEESFDTAEVREDRGEITDPDELRARLMIKDNRIKELYEEITASRLAADEARASKEAAERHVESLEQEGARLKEHIGVLEAEVRGRRRRREGLERQVARLERELERKDGEISHRDYLLGRRAEELDGLNQRSGELASRKDLALQDVLRRVDVLERDLEEKENEISNLRADRERRGRLADPANRLRAGIDLFNESEQRRSVNALSRTLGQPEVHVELEAGPEPPVHITFTWQGVTWQTYVSDPGPDVEEPRVYLKGAGEDLSGVDSKPPNARVGPGERVTLGR